MTNLTDLSVQRLKAPAKGQRIVFDEKLRGFGVRVSQGGAKSFVVVKGKERKLTTLGRYPELTLKDARIRAQKVFAEDMPHIPESRSATFLEAKNAFLEAKEKKLKPASIRLYKTYLKQFVWTKKVHLITKEEVNAALRKIEGKTAQNVAQQILKTFFIWCMKEEMIDRNPLAKQEAPNKLKSRDRVLSDDELKKLWAATDYPFGHLVRVLMLTGARREEIAQYGFGERYLHFEETKNGRSHTLPITPLVAEQLPVNCHPHWGDEKKLLDKRSGVTNWRLHDLRRTFSTNCARLKVPIHVTEKILNHVQGSISPIAAIYMRYDFEEEIREALLTHEAFILGLIRAQGSPLMETSTRGSDRSMPRVM